MLDRSYYLSKNGGAKMKIEHETGWKIDRVIITLESDYEKESVFAALRDYEVLGREKYYKDICLELVNRWETTKPKKVKI